ncbi:MULTISPECIES: hypothetical protein [unclassified Streptomyces]|uniref:hypothetical protein n=1 Tax=unclassified Streptomyces TaxID=2593676 RepID=UPI001488FF08|nr:MULTISPECIES: hypothetical protein [unclassified Streptomyces]
MTVPETGTLSVALGRCISAGTPLGPFEGTRFPGLTTASDTGLIHAVEDCPHLRKASSVRAVGFSLDAFSLERLCTNWSCRWAVPDDGRWPVFLDALDALSRLWSKEEEEDTLPSEADVVAAAGLLSLGEFPEDEDDADAWERHVEARVCRDDLLALWRKTQHRLITAGDGLAACPWLRSRAEVRMMAWAERAEEERRLLTRFFAPRTLADGAAVASLAAPALTADTDFGVFGSEAPQVLRRIWRAWLAGARGNAKPLAEAAMAAEQELHEALGRRRKGRDEAEESLARLTTAWAEQARLAAAERSAGRPWRLIAVRIPPQQRSPHGRGVYDPLTSWDLAVVAVYQVAVDWYRGTAALWVPQGIGEQLLAAEGSMKAVDLLLDAEDWAAPAFALLAAWEPEQRDVVA